MALFLNTAGGAWDNAKKYVRREIVGCRTVHGCQPTPPGCRPAHLACQPPPCPGPTAHRSNRGCTAARAPTHTRQQSLVTRVSLLNGVRCGQQPLRVPLQVPPALQLQRMQQVLLRERAATQRLRQ